MGTRFPELWNALAAEFHPGDVKTLRKAGRDIPYITARTAMNRLDDVLGPESWWDEYLPLEHSVVCKLTVRLPDGSTVTKCDAGGYAGMSDQGDDDKSGFSDSFKRAAAKFGIARYLYGDGVPRYERETTPALAEPDPEPEGRTDPALRAKRQALADIAKPLGVLITDLVAAAVRDLQDRCTEAGVDFPLAQKLPGSHQVVNHMLKWSGLKPEGKALSPHEARKLLESNWDLLFKRTRGEWRLELIGYLDRVYGEVFDALAGRGDAHEPDREAVA